MPMSLANFIAIYYFLDNGQYPVNCVDRKDRQRVHYQARKYKIVDGRILEVATGRELLHEGTAWSIIKKVHEEGHMGILNTIKKVVLAFVCSETREVVTDVVKSCHWGAKPSVLW
ncbi:hypothetical protein G6F56_004720 [Rhizopus delemar]|nr:hypothetical protein G6F56_004720 [Rhizopus delemar]